MLNVAFKGSWSRKRRLVGTIVAVFLGVAFLAGALTLGSTVQSNFNRLFANANAGTDAIVRSDTALGSGINSKRVPISASLVGRVAAVPGVADAQPSITGSGKLLQANGKALDSKGPTTAGNWITDPTLNAYKLVAGRAPQGDNEVVINQAAATKGKLRIGDRTTVDTPQPVPVRVVGIADFATAGAMGETTFTAFSLSGAERYVTGRSGQVNQVLVKAAPGVSQNELVSRIERVLPPGVQATTGAQLTHENISDLNGEFLNILRTFLLVFAGIALLVATFSIYNTFSILVAQRSRESALLRVVGASRRQVLGSVVAETAAVGLVASAAGLVGGLGIAELLKAVFNAFGFGLPAGGLVVTGTTIAVSMVVGVLTTVASGLLPAIRASRIPPLAALRDSASEAGALTIGRAVAAVVLVVAGVATVLFAVTGTGSGVLAMAGGGALITIVGLVVLGPMVAVPATRILGWPLARLRGAPGVLARGNAMRSPRRSAAAASALMVGVAVVTLFTVFAASLKTSMHDNLAGSFRGDLAISTASYGDGGLSPQLAGAIGRLPGVQTAAGVAKGNAQIAGKSETVRAVDPPQVGAVLDLHPTAGSLSTLSDTQFAVSQKTAQSKHWNIGTPLAVTYPDGTRTTLTVGAIYRSRDLLGDYVFTSAEWAPHAVQTLDSAVLIKLDAGASVPASLAAVRTVAASYGSPTVQDRSAYLSSAGSEINTLLGLIYALLALAIIIALFGIANTLTLSIHERTRELGLLRAVGETRPQLRAMIRWESMILAVFGTIGGLGLGVFLGWGLADAASTAEGMASFTAPPTQLVVILVVGAVAGVLAGIRPARRAARLDVLGAIGAE